MAQNAALVGSGVEWRTLPAGFLTCFKFLRLLIFEVLFGSPGTLLKTTKNSCLLVNIAFLPPNASGPVAQWVWRRVSDASALVNHLDLEV